MVDLTITVANVDYVSGSRARLDAAETITAGDAIYAASGTTCGVCDVTDETKDVCIGVALNDGTAGHPITYAVSGAVVTIGSTIVVGTWYVISASGALAPAADLATNDYVSFVGYGITTANMKLQIINTGLQFA